MILLANRRIEPVQVFIAIHTERLGAPARQRELKLDREQTRVRGVIFPVKPVNHKLGVAPEIRIPIAAIFLQKTTSRERTQPKG